jgi:integrase/recombinase XerD
VSDWEQTVLKNRHPAVNDFLESKENTGKSKRTLNAYSRILQKFYHEHFPELEPEDTEVRHVEQYLGILNRRDLSQNSKRRYLESLSAFFTWAMKRPRFKDINGNPAAVLLEDIPKHVRDRPDCATWENAKKVVRSLGDPRNKVIAALLAKTGCRVSEALNIHTDDLLLDEGFVRLRERKGGKQTVAPIDAEMITAFRRFQVLRRDADSEFLFVSMKGDQINRERMRRVIRNAAVQTEVMEQGETRFHKKFTPHTFRSVFTTLMRNQGMSDHILQYIRGDSNQDIMDVYTRVDRTQAREEYLDCIKKIRI